MDAQDGQDFLMRDSGFPHPPMADICERRRRICERRRRICDFHGNDGMKTDNVN